METKNKIQQAEKKGWIKMKLWRNTDEKKKKKRTSLFRDNIFSDNYPILIEANYATQERISKPKGISPCIPYFVVIIIPVIH